MVVRQRIILPIGLIGSEDGGGDEDEEDEEQTQHDAQMRQSDAEGLHSPGHQLVHQELQKTNKDHAALWDKIRPF